MKTKTSKNQAPISVKIPEEAQRKLKALAYKEDRSVSYLIRKAIVLYVEKEAV